jgi:heptosyltransferase II
MPASPASASSEPGRAPAAARPRVLIVGVNWLGDSIMNLPAIRELRRRLPQAWIALLVKPGMAPLWGLCPDVNDVFTLRPGIGGMRAAAEAVHAEAFDFAYVLPHSFRSALVPFLARVPGRKGQPGHARDWMLTETIPLPADAPVRHQVHEYLHLMGLDSPPPEIRVPLLHVPADARSGALQRLGEALGGAGEGALVGLFPGAARGASKRWPAGRFAELGTRLSAQRIVVLGSGAERAACEDVAARIGPRAASLAGTLSLVELAAVLTQCRVVVANDSGGMHLAAALDVPVVGIFGLTDPVRTGPLGDRCRIVAAAGVARSRDIPRESAGAQRALESIGVEAVHAATLSLLGA